MRFVAEMTLNTILDEGESRYKTTKESLARMREKGKKSAGRSFRMVPARKPEKKLRKKK